MSQLYTFNALPNEIHTVRGMRSLCRQKEFASLRMFHSLEEYFDSAFLVPRPSPFNAIDLHLNFCLFKNIFTNRRAYSPEALHGYVVLHI